MSDTTEEATSRRRFLFECGALGLAATAALVWNRRASDSVAPPYPPIVVPPTKHALLRQRVENLHRRYSAVLAAGGVPAVRQRVANDIRSFAVSNDWLSSISEWINLAGWNDVADLLIDIAEIGDNVVRVGAATLLAVRPTPLITASVHGQRVVRLHKTETEALAAESWRDLRARLGV